MAAAGIAHADFTGKVIGVVDGDTLDVLVDQRSVRVRLAEIDAPEAQQAWGTRSKQALAGVVFGRLVTVRDEGLARDRKRTVGTVFLNGESVNRMMVAAGMAWVYPAYARDRSLYAVEADARAARRGLWADAAPFAPWCWRAMGRVGDAIAHRQNCRGLPAPTR